MTVQALPMGRERRGPRSDAFHLVCFGLIMANAAYLAAALLGKAWILDAGGRPLHTDFTSVYAAGRLVLDGTPAAAYDWTLHYVAENAVSSHSAMEYLGWHYPPPFLMIAAVLAAMPYATAFIVWIGATLPLYLVTIRTIVGDRIGWLVAGAFPCLLPNIIPGQNGFLTASLVGGALGLLERQPIAAGVCLGLLTYKPQFGILFPLILVAGRHWRALGAATVAAILLALLSVVLLGVTPWTEFFHWLPRTTQALFSQNSPIPVEWNKFQSLLALVRLLGGSASLAWTLQIALTVITAIALCMIWWRDCIAYELKAAAAALGVLLATPYVYLYDLIVLAVSAAFLIRCALANGFIAGEAFGLGFVAALFVIMPFVGVPVGLMAVAVMAVLILRRAVRPA